MCFVFRFALSQLLLLSERRAISDVLKYQHKQLRAVLPSTASGSCPVSELCCYKGEYGGHPWPTIQNSCFVVTGLYLGSKDP